MNMFNMLFDALGIKPDHIVEAQQAIQDMARIARETQLQLDRIEARVNQIYEVVDYLERAHDDPAAIRQDHSELPSFDKLTPTVFEIDVHAPRKFPLLDIRKHG